MRLLTFFAVLLVGAIAGAAPFKAASPGLRAIGFDAAFADFLNEQLAQGMRESGVEVVTASDIRALIGLERQKELLGCKESNASCMAELANALGVDGLVVGDVVQLDKSIQVSVRVVSSTDGRTLTFDSLRVEGREALSDAAVKSGRKMGLFLRGTPVTPKTSDAAQSSDAGVAASATAKPGKKCAPGSWCEADVYIRWIKESREAFDLNSVHASAADNVWAVGYGGTVATFDGERWIDRPVPVDLGGILRAVWSPSPQLAFVAGQNGAAFKWKGQGWIKILEPNYAAFHALHGTPDGKNVWAATDKGILKLDGSEWRVMWAEQEVRDLFVVSAADIWAVAKQKVLRFRDGKWTVVANAPKEKYSAVFALSAKEIWFGADGVLIRHDPEKKGEAAWRRFPQGSTAFSTLWGTASDDLWAGGTYGALLHFDGEDWVSIPAPAGGYVSGLTGAGKNDIWFVQDLPAIRPGGGVFHFSRGQ